MIVINLEKAKELKKQMVRRERKPLLEALDAEMMKALESGDAEKQAEVAAKKQALRDATQHESIINANDVNELKQANPLDL